MKILYGSDLHLEFDHKESYLDQIEYEECDVLILAGDIISCDMAFPHSFFQKVSEKAGLVLYVPGNHEFYSSGKFTYQDCLQMIGNECSRYSNLIFGVNITKKVGMEHFVGSTLWTSFQDGKYTKAAQSLMNDYRQCKDLKAEFTAKLHEQDFRHMVAYLDEHSVAFSHHAPSKASLHPRYAHKVDVNACYSTDIINKLDRQPKVWIHGHTHDEFNYMEGETNVLANPRGYWGYETFNKYTFNKVML